jgi:lysophospholipase L1-like esterase
MAGVVRVVQHRADPAAGKTMKSFLTALRFDKVLDRMKAGDFRFIQFGHNDQKTAWPQT